MRVAAAEEGIQFASTAARSGDDPLWLGEDAFVSSLDHIFGHHKYTTHAHKLFQLLDPFNTGKVRWRQLVDRLVAVGAKKTGSRVEAWVPVTVKSIIRLDHCKRETIVKLVNLEREDSFCYVAVSRGGRVGIYSATLDLLHSYEIFYHRTGLQRRVKNCWITDAVYLPDVQYVIYSASDRSLTVYDVATLSHTPVYCITGLPHLPTCLAYSQALSDGTSELAIGSERGDVTRLRFLQPRLSLFHTKTAEQINYYFWMELAAPPHNTYCSITRWRRVHSRSVRRLSYSRDSLTSCSHDAVVSVRKRDTRGKLDDFVLGMQRGVSSYHAVSSLGVVVAGGAEGVRVWGRAGGAPLLSARAPGGAGVLDVALIPSREIVLAYCSDCSLHIWDLYEECLLQTIKINFPFLGVLGKKVEFGAYCIHPGPPSLPHAPAPAAAASPAPSRRSSVSCARSDAGGLVLCDDTDTDTAHGLDHDYEYGRYSRATLQVTCREYVATLRLAAPRPAPPPPRDTRAARRPSAWDLPDDVFRDQTAHLVESSSSSFPRHVTSAPTQFLSPSTAAETEYPVQDLDTLLENAGLQGILEKDFVLMQGLKHDLSKRIADMQANMSSLVVAVRSGAPHLALRTHAPTPCARAGAGVRERVYSRERECVYSRVRRRETPVESSSSTR